jgi:hypothetical protein
MSGEIVNLRMARKRRGRAQAEAAAEANRVKFGRSKEDRQLSEAQRELEARRIEGHRRDQEPEAKE